jgi:hypothetical protein
MKNIKGTPLFILFVGQLLTGCYMFVPKDGYPEDWSFWGSFFVCLSAFVFLGFDFILKRFITNKERLLQFQFLVAAIIIFCFLIFDLTIFKP